MIDVEKHDREIKQDRDIRDRLRYMNLWGREYTNWSIQITVKF